MVLRNETALFVAALWVECFYARCLCVCRIRSRGHLRTLLSWVCDSAKNRADPRLESERGPDIPSRRACLHARIGILRRVSLREHGNRGPVHAAQSRVADRRSRPESQPSPAILWRGADDFSREDLPTHVALEKRIYL